MSEKAVIKLYDAAGNVTATITGAAVQRDLLYTDQHKNRDNQTAKMFAKSGVQVKMEMITLADGSKAYLPKEFSVRGEPRFQQNLETRPPDHRGWQTADKFVDLLTFGTGAYFLNDFGKHSVSSGRPSYQGDYNYQSYNPQTAQPYFAPVE
ncbi:hypothetical protein [Desulforhopalus singaporensis]|nr:hypothetical protein [Desulforhopalus singaporensis]